MGFLATSKNKLPSRNVPKVDLRSGKTHVIKIASVCRLIFKAGNMHMFEAIRLGFPVLDAFAFLVKLICFATPLLIRLPSQTHCRRSIFSNAEGKHIYIYIFCLFVKCHPREKTHSVSQLNLFERHPGLR